jgi:hypothetical protein
MYRPYTDAQTRHLFSSHVYMIMVIWVGFYVVAVGSALFEVDWSGASQSAAIGSLSVAADRRQLKSVAENSLKPIGSQPLTLSMLRSKGRVEQSR